jgi:S1-C subfamily serine protease
MCAMELMTRNPGDALTLALRRGSRAVSLTMSAVEGSPEDDEQLSGMADPEKNLILKLGIVAIDVRSSSAAPVPKLRIQSGVLVVARERESSAVSLLAGDVIHAINGFAIRSADGLRVLVDGLDANSEVTLQIERDGRLRFVTLKIF